MAPEPPHPPLPPLNAVEQEQLDALNAAFMGEMRNTFRAVLGDMEKFAGEILMTTGTVSRARAMLSQATGRPVTNDATQAIFNRLRSSQATPDDLAHLEALRSYKALGQVMGQYDFSGMNPEVVGRFLAGQNLNPNSLGNLQDVNERKGRRNIFEDLGSMDFTHPGQIFNVLKRHWGVAAPLGVASTFFKGLSLPGIGRVLPGYNELRDTGMELGLQGMGAADYGMGSFLGSIRMGINPFDVLGVGDARKIQKVFRGRGYQGARARELEDATASIVNDLGIDAEDAATMMADAMKRGNESVESFTTTLKGLDTVAQNAGLSVGQVVETFKSLNDYVTSKGGTSVEGAALAEKTLANYVMRDASGKVILDENQKPKPAFGGEESAKLIELLDPTGLLGSLVSTKTGIDPFRLRTPSNINQSIEALGAVTRDYLASFNVTSDMSYREKADEITFLQESEKLGPQLQGLTVPQIISLMEPVYKDEEEFVAAKRKEFLENPAVQSFFGSAGRVAKETGGIFGVNSARDRDPRVSIHGITMDKQVKAIFGLLEDIPGGNVEALQARTDLVAEVMSRKTPGSEFSTAELNQRINNIAKQAGIEEDMRQDATRLGIDMSPSVSIADDKQSANVAGIVIRIEPGRNFDSSIVSAKMQQDAARSGRAPWVGTSTP